MYTEWQYRDELYHHGIKGQKWGIRRFQNSDGTLTPEGKERYYGYNKTPKAKDLSYDELYGYKYDVEVPKNWGGFNVSYNKTEMSYGKYRPEQKQIDDSFKEMNDFIESFNKKGSKTQKQIIDAIYKEYGHTQWDDVPRSKEQFVKNLKEINSLSFGSHKWNTSDITKEPLTDVVMYIEDGGMFGGHVFSVEYYPKHKKVGYISLEG